MRHKRLFLLAGAEPGTCRALCHKLSYFGRHAGPEETFSGSS